MADKKWRFVGVSFDHIHLGDLLSMVYKHPNAEIVGLYDEQPERMTETARRFHIPAERLYTDLDTCLTDTAPDFAILCPATARHAEFVERTAPFNVHILVEKPFAASLADADAMIAAMERTGKRLFINWPLAWYPCHRTAKRLIDEGAIGDVLEVHYYDGNRGPLRHLADKQEVSEEEAERMRAESWWYRTDKGGGSLLDYLGYGVTLGTWFLNGRAPREVTCITDAPDKYHVDEHSMTIARYDCGLSCYETRWGAFTDPWTFQPQPKCGFVLAGSKGTISSYDYEPTVRLQTQSHPEGFDHPVDVLKSAYQNPINHIIHCIETGEVETGPLSPSLCRIGQRIVEGALISVMDGRTVPLPK